MLQEKELVLKSLAIATQTHENQYRRDGQTPYIVHPIAVAKKMDSPILQSIALLHDVLEDTNISPKDLIAKGILRFVVEIVKILTKKDGEKYLDYILRVKSNKYATLVKIEDIKHNYTTVQKSKQERYDMALYILKGNTNEPIS